MKIADAFYNMSDEYKVLTNIESELNGWLEPIINDGNNDGPHAVIVEIDLALQLVSVISEAARTKIVIREQPCFNESYWVLPNGDMVLCQESKHNEVALSLFLERYPDKYREVIKEFSVHFIRSVALKQLGWIEFSVQGTEKNIITSEWYKSSKVGDITKKQKEALAKILEVNNIKDERHWKYVY